MIEVEVEIEVLFVRVYGVVVRWLSTWIRV